MSSSLSCYQKLQVLHNFKEKVESVLEEYDFTKIVQELLRAGILDKNVKKELDCLDHDLLEKDLKVRYLLQNVYERMESDEHIYERLVRVLTKHGGCAKSLCEAMRKEMNKDEGDHADLFLRDSDVPALTEVLVSGSHKWEEIGIAIGLPEYVKNDCGKGDRNPVRLTNILTAWIQGGHDGSSPPTLHNLRAALTGEIVGLPKLALSLNQFASLPGARQLTSKCDSPEIICFPIDTEVAEAKSTLLEVQVSSDTPVNYQWMKDGKVISDLTRYSGISNSILYVAKASLETQGKYSCSITCGTTSLTCEEVDLIVRLSKEKELLSASYVSTNKLLSQETWPPVSTDMFHTLVLHTKVEHKEQYTTIPGDVDKVMENKERISYEEAFSMLEEGSLVLVEGRPGSGKTTLVHKLVTDWATGKVVLLNSKLVFLVTLRALKNSDSIMECLSIYYSNKDFCSKIVQDFEKCNGMNIYFVLDGLDECPFRNEEQSFIYKLLYKKYLPLSVVIVTSRPVALRNDLKACSRRNIEVIGFTKKNTLEYINSYPFQSINSECNNMASDLIAYVKRHVNVLHMCYLPLHAAIICFLFSELEGNIPSTETQIYEQFAIATILRKMKREKKCTLQIKSLKNLDESVMEKFLRVCSLAFDMTVKSYLVVSKNQALITIPDKSGSDEFSLGLLTVQQTSKLYGTEDMYAFHHLTIQEYLAAYHITELEEYEQDLVLYEYGEDDDLQNMWKFYFGIKTFNCKLDKFSKILSATISGSTNIIQYAFESQQTNVCSYVVELNKGTLSFEDEDLTHSNFFAINYIVATSSYHVSRLEFIDCNFDKNSVLCLDDDALKFVKQCSLSTYSDSSSLNILLSKLSSLEVLDIRYWSTLNETTIITLTKNITLPQLRIIKIGSNFEYLMPDIVTLLRFRSNKIEQVYIRSSSLRKLFMIKNAICHSFGFRVYSGKNFPSLYLYNNPEKLPFLCYELLKTYVEIALVNCDVNDHLTKALADGFKSSPCLMSIELDFNQISDSGALVLADSIDTLTKISKVSLQCNCISDSGAIALAGCIARSHTLRWFDLQGNLLGDEGAAAIANAANLIPQLQIFLCNVNLTKVGVKRVLEYNKNVYVEELISTSFSWMAIEENGPDAVMRALKCGDIPIVEISGHVQWLLYECSKKKFKILKITGSNISGGTLSCISKYKNNVEMLIVSDSRIVFMPHRGIISKKRSDDRDELINLTSAISVCCNLHTLCLPHNNIDSTYASNIFLILKCLKHLKRLNLSHNYIVNIDLVDLWQHCRDLMELDLSHNGIVFYESSSEIVDMAIQVLDLSFNDLKSCVCLLNKLLMHCSDLVSLNISGNSIGSDVVILVEGLTHSSTLQKLAFGRNNIGFEDVTALAEVISQNVNLKAVNFCHNQITADGARILSEAFTECQNLTYINLSGNFLSAEGVRYLVDSLKSCADLSSLKLSHTGLDENGATVFDDFQCGIHLLELDLGHNNFSSATQVSLDEWQDYEELPEELLSNIVFESYGIEFLAKGLEFCLNLKRLCLAKIGIDKNGVELIANSLKHCHTLEHLDISYNPSVGSEGAAILVERLQRQSDLTLNLTDSIASLCMEALLNAENCCSSCKKLLSIYYSNDSLFLLLCPSSELTIPKVVSKVNL